MKEALKDGRRQCTTVHPLHLARLRDALIGVLSEATEIESESQVFWPLRCVQSVQDLARISWGVLYEDLQRLTQLPGAHLAETIVLVQLCADRTVLHARLYLARSGSTLQCLRTCALPCTLPRELRMLRREFGQHLQEADAALKSGRALLDRFQREALLGEPIPRLRAILVQAERCSAAYRQAMRSAREIIGYVAWYLSWVETDDLADTEQVAEIREWLSQHPPPQRTAHVGTHAA